MNERQTGEGRQDRWTSQSDRDPEGNEGSQRSMTRSQQAGEMSQHGTRSSADWTGYVVPYRYYGPGYRGVGYYSVFYQGSGEQGTDADWDEGGRGRSQQHGAGTGRSSAASGGSGASGYGGSDYGGSDYGGASGYGGAGGGGGYRSGRGYSGRGPKGYQRSDERIQEDVNDRLMADDRIDASEIEVQVHDGEVTLLGTVADRWAKRMAEDLVEQVMGVREVMNQIRVTQGESGQTGQPEGQWPSGQTQTGKSGQTRQTDQSQTQGDSNGRRQKAGSTSR